MIEPLFYFAPAVVVVLILSVSRWTRGAPQPREMSGLDKWILRTPVEELGALVVAGVDLDNPPVTLLAGRPPRGGTAAIPPPPKPAPIWAELKPRPPHGSYVEDPGNRPCSRCATRIQGTCQEVAGAVYCWDCTYTLWPPIDDNDHAAQMAILGPIKPTRQPHRPPPTTIPSEGKMYHA